MLPWQSRGGNQAPSSITPAPGTLWSSWNGAWSLGCDESSGLTRAGACARSSGPWGLTLPPGTRGGLGRGLPVLREGLWERGLFLWELDPCSGLRRWRRDEPAVAQMWPLRARGDLTRSGGDLICCGIAADGTAGRNGGTRHAKAGCLILNCFPCQGTNMPRFKIIIIKPGRRSREPKILQWVLVCWQMPGWGCLVGMSSQQVTAALGAVL